MPQWTRPSEPSKLHCWKRALNGLWEHRHFFYIFIYLFIYIYLLICLAVLGLSCGMWDLVP